MLEVQAACGSSAVPFKGAPATESECIVCESSLQAPASASAAERCWEPQEKMSASLATEAMPAWGQLAVGSTSAPLPWLYKAVREGV